MKFYLLLLILLIPLTSAIQFSPTSLEFNLEKNQVSCKKISFEIESPATVHDAWAQNSLGQWSISNFQTSSEQYGIEISYPSEINPDQGEIQFCLSGSKSGNYRGALIFRQDEVGNSIVQFAVWLKVNIKGEIEQESIEPSDKKSHLSGGSSGVLWISESLAPPNKEVEDLNFEVPDKEIKLNKPSLTKETQSPINQILLIIFPIIMIIALAIILTRNR